MHRDFHAGQPANPRGGRAGRVDHKRRGHRALRRGHAGRASARHRDGGHVHALDDLRAKLPGAAGEAIGDLGRPGHAVARAPHRRDEVVDAQRRHDRLRLGRRDLAHVHPEPALQRDALAEAAQVRLVGDQEEVADLAIPDVDAELVVEALEDADGLEREADLGLGGKLRADTAGSLARRAAADGLPLEDDDVALAAPGEVIGDAAADDAAADDDDTGRPGQGHQAWKISARPRDSNWLPCALTRVLLTRPKSVWL